MRVAKKSYQGSLKHGSLSMEDLRNSLNSKRRKRDQQSQVQVAQLPTPLTTIPIDLEKLKDELKEDLLREMWVVDIARIDAPCHTPTFNKALLATLFPDNFKMPSLPPYDEKGNLVAHVEVFYM